MTARQDDTICAIATPIGEGGIGIVRISGTKAVEAAQAVLQLRSGALTAVKSRTLCQADLLETARQAEARPGSARILDDVLVTVMRAPRSYTGEDVVEIHCHGGPLVLQHLCEALVRHGTRLAEPGEFTKRAFLTGRLDLTQAEAVLDTIQAKTRGALTMAQAQLRGSLSNAIATLRDRLIGLLAELEAGIDFSDEDITFIETDALLAGLSEIDAAVTSLLQSSEEGRRLREGVAVPLIGRPNVGKSSLLNALLQSDRAIVTPVPGTTRDILEETLNIRGLPVRLLDTAGLRESEDPVEQEGIRRSRAAIEDAALILLIVDGSVPLTDEDRALLSEHRGRSRLIVLNKVDLVHAIRPTELSAFVEEACGEPVAISAKTGAGLDLLRDRLRTALLRADFEPAETAVATRLRHQTALQTAQESLRHAAASAQDGFAAEVVAVDLRGALDALGEITGAVTTDEILTRIFSEFCIGK